MPPRARVLPGCTSAAASLREISLLVMRGVLAFSTLFFELRHQLVQFGCFIGLLLAQVAASAQGLGPLRGLAPEALFAAQHAHEGHVEAEHQRAEAADDEQAAWVGKELFHACALLKPTR